MDRLLFVMFGDSKPCALIEAVNTSETSVNCYQITWRNIPEDGHLQGGFIIWEVYQPRKLSIVIAIYIYIPPAP
jgi:hypothetical protein